MQLSFVGGDKAKIQQVRNISIYDFYQFMAKEREQNLRANEIHNRVSSGQQRRSGRR